jgi:uncharacterized protein (UPF0335 family)
MRNKKVKLLDIEFDINLVNITQIAKTSSYSFTYTRLIINNVKKSEKARRKVRNAIVKLYNNLIKYTEPDNKL